MKARLRTSIHFAVGYGVALAACLSAFALWSRPAPAQARYRRLLAVGTCYGIRPGTTQQRNGGAAALETIAQAEIDCPLPSDSYLTHGEVKRVNLHVRRAAADNPFWWFGVRPCVHSYQEDRTECGLAARPLPDVGVDTTLQITDAQHFSAFRDSRYAGWGPYLHINTLPGDLIRFIYVTD